MNKLISLGAALVLLMNIRCNTKKLSNDEVGRLLSEAKAYPHVVEAKLFINEGETASKIIASNLDDDGYVTAQPRHTSDDVGQSLIHFTDKSAPYLLPKPDSVESIEIQLVKVGDEVFSKVVSVAYSNDGNEAEVAYEIKIENPTPFTSFLRPNTPTLQYRRTGFIKTADGWQWNKKVVITAKPN
ncbi:MAG: hypothetical protein WDO14_22155 [Bacteroidota bacterium]